MKTTQKISSCLWFDKNAEDAVDFYLSVFKNSRKLSTTYYSKEGQEQHHMPDGLVLAIDFELNGSTYIALNGGPIFKFNEAVSFVVNCETQEEIDYYWDKLTEGGDKKAQQCGWLKDKFGLSWQVTPTAMQRMLMSRDRAQADRVMHVMMQMKKLDLKALQDAYDGK